MDLAASLRVFSVQVEFGEAIYTLPPTVAGPWLEAFHSQGWAGIFPGMLDGPDSLAVGRAIIRGEATSEDVLACARDALELAAGRRWWWAERLVAALTATKAWPAVHGQLYRAGVRLDVAPLGALLDAVYSMCVEGLTEDKRVEFDRELEAPPAGVPVAEVFDEAEAQDDFIQALEAFEREGG